MSLLGLFNVHNHTCYSNFRLRDSVNKIETLIDYAYKIGNSGICITDHECLSSHVQASKFSKKYKDFKVSYGNEIYLVDRDLVAELKDRGEKIAFNHFILIAKNERGYEALKKLSSNAWKNSFYYRFMERVPTYKDELEQIMIEYKGDLIASTACIGGELPQLLIEYHKDPSPVNKLNVHTFISWLLKLFGEDLYFELQPSHSAEQIIVNRMLLKTANAYNIKCIVSTDSHYLNKKQAKAHEIYLQASDGDREVSEFYATTYLMSKDELLEFFCEEDLDIFIKNSLEIRDKITDIDFEQEVKVPQAHIPKYEMNNLLIPYYNKYEYIKKYSESKEDVDRYLLHLTINGLQNKNEELNDKNLSRINIELEELWHISESLKQPLSAYFVVTKDIVDLIWQVSLIGVSRGSASCFYINYLLDIVQINPIKYNLPHWRFISKERPELPDIDLDFEGDKRHEIMRLAKEEYGYDNVLNVTTYTTEASKSAALTACRGLGIDRDVSQNIANLIPNDKSGLWSLDECFNGNEEKNKKPARQFIIEVEKYENLKETMLTIEGLVSGRGQHASAVIIFKDGYIAQNALMKTTSGLEVTQFDAVDTTYMGGLKLDFLSLSGLNRIRTAIELLLEYNKIEWQGSLRETYNKYFHPDVLELEAPEMYNMLFKGDVFNAFQFETLVGRQALTKLNARSFTELCSGNSLMRLTTSGEQPLDKFIRFKNDINEWYKEMSEYNLNEEEQEVLKNRLLETFGICDSQESLMELCMDPKITGFNLTQANKFRKAVAKQNQQLLEEQKIIFYHHGKELNTSKSMLNYVWNFLLKPQFSYAFSKPRYGAFFVNTISGVLI